ncbi:MAG: nuclease domain-containing protein [Lachnospiraceae bacterium]|nr:nuclease domain-containing protein [Lachnospiraceae bacterium]
MQEITGLTKLPTMMAAGPVIDQAGNKAPLSYNSNHDKKGLLGGILRFFTRKEDTSYTGVHELGHVLASLAMDESGGYKVWEQHIQEANFVREALNQDEVMSPEERQGLVYHQHTRDSHVGERIELFYNPRYGRSSNQENDGKSQAATTPQKPDNVLSLTKRIPGKNGSKKGNGQQYEYVFDAKYRIGADADYKARHQGLEGPKEEDINTMHRYRDAIVYDMNRNAAASNDAVRNMLDAGAGAGDGIPGPFDRTMFGAYVLFPYSDEEKYKQHDFYKSIETVNIGGFPFLPSATNMVRNFLEELISDTAESAFERATLPRGIEEKLARVDWKKRDVLIVNVPDEAEAACLAERSCMVRGMRYRRNICPFIMLRSISRESGLSISVRSFSRRRMRPAIMFLRSRCGGSCRS